MTAIVRIPSSVQNQKASLYPETLTAHTNTRRPRAFKRYFRIMSERAGLTVIEFSNGDIASFEKENFAIAMRQEKRRARVLRASGRKWDNSRGYVQ